LIAARPRTLTLFCRTIAAQRLRVCRRAPACKGRSGARRDDRSERAAANRNGCASDADAGACDRSRGSSTDDGSHDPCAAGE
jgi:hypothetical protein